MLLPRITRPRCSRHVLRCSSSIRANLSYASKVRAYPFAFSLEDALVRLGPTISANAGGQDILQSLAARFLPGLGFKPIQPQQAKAVYVPAWIIDAEVEAKFWLKTAEEQEAGQHTLRACFQDSFMPGFALDPLSRISLKSSALIKHTTVQWTPDLERQFDQDVLCVPYTMTPFSLPSLVHSASFKDAVISDDFRFDPSSVKDHFVAAYPVLIPIYLLHFPVDLIDHVENLTVVIEAYRHGGNYTIGNIMRGVYKEFSPMLPSAITNKFSIMEDIEFIRYGPGVHAFMNAADVRSLHALPASSRGRHLYYLEQWIDKFFMQKGNMQAYQTYWQRENPDGKVDWEDLRIREFVPEEVNAVRSYMDMGIVEANLREMNKTMGGIFSTSGTDWKDSSPTTTTDDGSVEPSLNTDSKLETSDKPTPSENKDEKKKQGATYSFQMQSGETFKAMFIRDGSDALGNLVQHRQSRKPSWMSEYEKQRRLRVNKERLDAPNGSKN